MKLYPRKPCCDADITAETAMITEYRGNPKVKKRAKKVHHVRGTARFWHWSDVTPVTKSVWFDTD